jgi:hypothetical protein
MISPGSCMTLSFGCYAVWSAGSSDTTFRYEIAGHLKVYGSPPPQLTIVQLNNYQPDNWYGPAPAVWS